MEDLKDSRGIETAAPTRPNLKTLLYSLAILLLLVPTAHAGPLTVLHSFTGPDGFFPNGSLVQDKAGNLYGTTIEGGAFGEGTIFKIGKHGKESVLYSFQGGADGALPEAGLVMDKQGNLYGTTLIGGHFENGTVFRMGKNGRKTVLYSFATGTDGALPNGGLIFDAAGNLYGTTFRGGAANEGTVFKLEPSGTEIVLHNFTGPDGAAPDGGLVRDAAANLYGTTSAGGANTPDGSGLGTAFKLDPSGNETVLFSFTGGNDGALPNGALIADPAGNLYGATGGGSFGIGTVFEIDTNGTLSVLGSFSGGRTFVNGGLARDAAGNLYGTNEGDGDFGFGMVFKIDTSGKQTVLYSFTGDADGAFPNGGVIIDEAGNLYGTTDEGGASGGGTVFALPVGDVKSKH